MVDDDQALRQAELADNALAKDEYWGWMHGMPHAIKNLSNAKGLETSNGSPIFAGTIADGGRSARRPYSMRRARFSLARPIHRSLAWVRKATTLCTVPPGAPMTRA